MDKTNERDNYISCATAILKTAIEDIDRLGAGSATTTGAGVYSSSSQPSTSGVNTINNNVSINQSLQSRAQDNFRRAFPGLCGRSLKRSPSNDAKGKAPAKKNRYVQHFFKPKETWTHTFCALGCVSDDISPSKDEIVHLQKAGLGKRKVVFPHKNADHDGFMNILEKEYPKIKEGGGIELLRAVGGGGGQRKLEVLSSGPRGYSIEYLRNIICIGQATLYIRPLQKDLDLTPLPDKINEDKISSPKVTCLACGEKCDYGLLKYHRENECKQAIFTVKDAEDNNVGSDDEFIEVSKESTAVGSDDELIEVAKESTAVVSETKKSNVQSDYETEDDIFSNLKELFAQKDEKHLREVAENSFSTSEAVNSILENIDSTGKSVLMEILADKDKEEIIQQFRADKIIQGTQMIDIDRMSKSMLNQLMRIYKNPGLSIRKVPDISFSGETAADVGGPTREFFHVAIDSLVKVDERSGIQLFFGVCGHMLPLCSLDALSGGCFLMVGKLLAHSILHGGSGLVGLAPSVVKYIATGSVDIAQALVTVDDVGDIELKTVLAQVLDNSSHSLDETDRDKIESLMVRHGLSDLPLTDQNKEKAVQDIIVAEVLTTRTAALDAIFTGMNTCDLGTLMRSNPSVASVVFPSLEDAEVDVKLMKTRFKGIDSFDFDSDEKRNAVQWFLDFLEEADKELDPVSGKKLTSTLLMFITGSQILTDELKIEFNNDPTKSLLEADSCFNKVILPICHNSYTKFKQACQTSLAWSSQGYGRF